MSSKHALYSFFLSIFLSSCSRADVLPIEQPTRVPSTPTLAVTQIIDDQPPHGLEATVLLRSFLGSGQGGEVATSVIELGDGGFLIAGYDYDKSDSISEWDALVMRVSADGHKVWRQSTDRDGSEYAWVVREGQAGQFVVVGTWENDSGNTDGYMQGINADGNELWQRIYGGEKEEILWAAEPTPDGGFLLAGQTESEGAGGLDFYIVKTDGEGNELWSKAIGTEVTDRAFGIGLSPDGGALIAGFTGSSKSTMNFLFVRINKDGHELWRRTVAGDRFDVAHDVLSLEDGGFMISGYTSSFSPGDHDGFLMRLSADGRMLWMKTYGDSKDDRILHVVQLDDDGFALVGYSDWDMVVWRVDPDGDLVWSHRDGGQNTDVGKDIIAKRDGSIVAVGGNRSENPPYDEITLLILDEFPAP